MTLHAIERSARRKDSSAVMGQDSRQMDGNFQIDISALGALCHLQHIRTELGCLAGGEWSAEW
jgi:hypothetical protein